jgi:hypothetical protein
MKIDQSLQIPFNDKIRVSVYAPLSALSLIFPHPFPVSPFEESDADNPACVELARQIFACLFTPAPASHVMPDPIRHYGYLSRDKYSPEDAQFDAELKDGDVIDAELMDVRTSGIDLIFDHQVSSDDEDPDVVQLWIDEELKVTGRKNHKTDRARTNDMMKLINQSRRSLKVDFE